MKVKMYKMIMEFDVTVGLKEINDFTQMFGFTEKICLPNQTITLSQIISFIPDKEYINTVENIIKEKYKTEKMDIVKCHFKGYKELLETEIEVNEDSTKEQSDDEIELE